VFFLIASLRSRGKGVGDIREKLYSIGAEVTFEDRRWNSKSAPVIGVVDDTFVIDTRSDP
jgi:hypothetical protein